LVDRHTQEARRTAAHVDEHERRRKLRRQPTAELITGELDREPSTAATIGALAFSGAERRRRVVWTLARGLDDCAMAYTEASFVAMVEQTGTNTAAAFRLPVACRHAYRGDNPLRLSWQSICSAGHAAGQPGTRSTSFSDRRRLPTVLGWG
jgi:hypothetical protein